MTESQEKNNERYLDWKGTLFNNNYIGIEKLGHGAYSSVWLVYGITQKNLFALKISYTEDFYDCQAEYQTIKTFMKLKIPNIINVIESFTHDSKYCIVLNLMYSSLYQYIKNEINDIMPFKLLMKYLKQIITTIESMHSYGYIHTDIKPENILVKHSNKKHQQILDYMNSKTVEDLINIKFIENRKYKLPEKRNLIIKDILLAFINKEPDDNTIIESSEEESEEEIKSEYKFTRELMAIDEESDISDDESDIDEKETETIEKEYYEDIVIADLGNVIKKSDGTYSLQTIYYRAPEVMLQLDYDNKIDIWSLGCLIYELITGEVLFNSDNIEEINIIRYHIYDIQMKLGLIEKKVWDKCSFKDVFIRQDGGIRGINTIKHDFIWVKLFDKLNEIYTPDEIEKVLNLLMSCLTVDRDKRKTAKELLSMITSMDFQIQ